MIEAIFKKFDADGSGGLDIDEILDLFKQNKVNLDRDTVKKMFQADEFTLAKFKAIIDSPEDLTRFKQILKTKKLEIMNSQHKN